MFNIIQSELGVALSRLCACTTLSEKDLLYNILLNAGSGLPTLVAGEFLTNDGTAAFWAPIPGGGDVIASGTLTLNKLIIGGGGTTVSALATAAGILTFLSTPSGANLAAALTSALPASKGGTGLTALGTGVATWLGTPSGANLAAALTTALPASKGGTGLIALAANIVSILSAADYAAVRALLGVPLATSPAPATKVPVKVTATNYTIGTTDPNELYGGIIYVTGAATITIPAVLAGMNFTVITIGAVAVSVDPNAADLIYRDGVAQADGEKITNLSTAGDLAAFSYFDATGFHAATNGWTNGG